MKYNKNFERDYQFYINNLDIFSFAGKENPVVKQNDWGSSAKQAFYKYDSNGVMLSTYEPELLEKLFICKASVNLHIKMWAEGLKERTLLKFELAKYLQDIQAPAWVELAVHHQANKIGYYQW